MTKERAYAPPFLLLVSVLTLCGACERGPSATNHTSASGRPLPATPPDLTACPDPHVAGVGGADEAPIVMTRVEPDFGRRPAATGIIIVETVVARSGSVCAARVLRGLEPALDAAALHAVRQWQFVPAKKRGEAVQAIFNISVNVPAR